jgi:hypothetical protein
MALHDLPPAELGAKIHAQVDSHPSKQTPTNPEVHTQHSQITKAIGDTLFAGQGRFVKLYRSYKHTPHSPPSMLLKYLVHRINKIRDYDDVPTGDQLDKGFLDLHQYGKAREKNGHVTVADLHHWLRLNPHLVEQVARHAIATQNAVKRGVGLNLKLINGHDHVAMVRELNSALMNHEHGLSSFSDTDQYNNYGDFKHHVWVPLKDLYYSYDLGPQAASSEEFGPEDEYLFTHAADRYEAKHDDVHPLAHYGRRSHYFTGIDPEATDNNKDYIFDDAPDVRLADLIAHSNIGAAETMLQHPNAGPLSWHAAKEPMGARLQYRIDFKACPREDALNGIWQNNKLVGLRNPNLTEADLTSFLNAKLPQKLGPQDWVYFVENPKVSGAMLKQVFDNFYERDDGLAKHAVANLMEHVTGDRLAPEDFTKALEQGILEPRQIQYALYHNPSLQTGATGKLAFDHLWGTAAASSQYMANIHVNPDWIYEKMQQWPDNQTWYAPYSASLDPYFKHNQYVTKEDLVKLSDPNLPASAHRALLEAPYLPAPVMDGLAAKYATRMDDVGVAMRSDIANHPSISLGATKILLPTSAMYMLAHNEAVPPEWMAEGLPADLKPMIDEVLKGNISFKSLPVDSITLVGNKTQTILAAIRRKLNERGIRANGERYRQDFHIVKPLPPMAKSELEGIVSWLHILKVDQISLEKAQVGSQGICLGEQGDGYLYDYSHLVPKDLNGYRITLHDLGGPYSTEGLTPLPRTLGEMRLHLEHVNRPEEICGTLDGKVVGSSMGLQFKPTNAYLHPEHKGRALGQLLFNAAVTHANQTHNAPTKGEPVVKHEMPLVKMHTLPGFPRLGINRGGSGTYVINRPEQLKLRVKLTGVAEGISEGEAGKALGGAKGATVTNVTHPSRMAYVNNVAYQAQPYTYQGKVITPAPYAAMQPHEVAAIQNHENIHQLFNNVDEKFGKTGRHFLASNLINAIPVQYRNYIEEYMKHKNKHLDTGSQAEEKITYLHDYLNNRSTRNSWHSGHPDEYKEAFQEGMTRAHRALLAAAQVATPDWTQALVQKPGEFNDPSVKEPPWVSKWGGYGADQFYGGNFSGNTGFYSGKGYGSGIHSWDDEEGSEAGKGDLSHWFSDRGPSDKPPEAAAENARNTELTRQRYLEDKFDKPTDASLPPPPPKTQSVEEYLAWKRKFAEWQVRDAQREFDENDKLLQEQATKLNNPEEVEAAQRDYLKDALTLEGPNDDPQSPENHPDYDPGEPYWQGKLEAHKIDKMNRKRFDDPAYLIGDNTGINEEFDKIDDPYAEKNICPECVMDLNTERHASECPLNPKKPKGLRRHRLKKALPNLSDTPEEHSQVAEEMLGFVPALHTIFEAARFLINGPVISLEQMRRALWSEDGDMEKAALAAYGIGATKENIAGLRAVQKLIELSKAEEQPDAEQVEAAISPDGDSTAKQIEDSFNAGAVQKVALNGKYSRGALIARDPVSDNVYLLKPDAPGNSPAAGSDEEKSSQPRREAAFWHCADLMGLGQYIPRADLVFIDGHEWAAIKLLSYEYKNLEKRYRSEPNLVLRTINKYRDAGILHRWAVLDYILGNPDRHGQNMMIAEKRRFGHTVQEIALIDHGSAFAGKSFSPAYDKNSFIPFYLRGGAGAFNRLPGKMRLNKMPTISMEAEQAFAHWLDSLDVHKLARVLQKYAINPAPAIYRLEQLKALDGPKHQAINKLWAGT